MFIHNYTQNQYSPQFKGTFETNKVLEKAIEKASDYDLYHFGKNLERMNKVKDGKLFYLDWCSYPNPSLTREDIRLISYNGKDFNSILVGQSISRKSEAIPDKCYDKVIANINLELEKIYPVKQVTQAKRENSIRRINKYLTKEA